MVFVSPVSSPVSATHTVTPAPLNPTAGLPSACRSCRRRRPQSWTPVHPPICVCGARSIHSTAPDCASAPGGRDQIAPQNGALAQMALVLDGRKQRRARRRFRPALPRRNQNIDRDKPVRQRPITYGGGKARMNLVFGAIRPHPADVIQRCDLVRRRIVESGDEGILRYILEEFNAQCAQLRPFSRRHRILNWTRNRPEAGAWSDKPCL